MDRREYALGLTGAMVVASLLAIAVQPLVFFLWLALPPLVAGDGLVLYMAPISLIAAVVAIPFVLLVGVPSTLLLIWLGRLRWHLLAAIGFVAAALPMAAILLDGDSGHDGDFDGPARDLVIALIFGLHGLVGATVFYLAFRRSMGPGNSFEAASPPIVAMGPTDAWLVYDGECPVCRAYCLRVRINAAVGRLHLVDAREPSPLMDEITGLGLDIDQGMVLKFEDVIYYGPEAVRMLTLLGTRVGWFNRLAVAFFGGTRRADFWYPIGKAARNVVLKVLGIQYIDNLGQAKRDSFKSNPLRDST